MKLNYSDCKLKNWKILQFINSFVNYNLQSQCDTTIFNLQLFWFTLLKIITHLLLQVSASKNNQILNQENFLIVV